MLKSFHPRAAHDAAPTAAAKVNPSLL